jgi:hypothetical protein
MAMTTLVLYAFHEYNSRVEQFIRTAVFEDPSVDFVFIANNVEADIALPAHVKLLKRPNIGYDFGAWSHGLFYNQNYTKYTNYIFVNSSVLGPFLPAYYKGKWTDIFVEGLAEAELFGSTINTLTDPLTTSHIQSYIFSMNQTTALFLIDRRIFSLVEHARSMTDAIINREIRMSREILGAGWRIGCLMRLYQGVDFRFVDKKPGDYPIVFKGDLMAPMILEDTLFENYYETVFIKGNRLHVRARGLNALSNNE